MQHRSRPRHRSGLRDAHACRSARARPRASCAPASSTSARELLVEQLPRDRRRACPSRRSASRRTPRSSTVDEFRLDPARPAAELDRIVRAGNPRPGAWMPVGGKRVKVWRAHPIDAARRSTCAPGVDHRRRRARAPPRARSCSTRCSPRASARWPATAWRAGLRADAAGRPRDARSTGRRARALAVDALAAHRRRRVRAHPRCRELLRKHDLEPRDRAFVTELVYGTVRMQRALDFLLARVVSNRGIDSLDPAGARRAPARRVPTASPACPPHAAVGETVGVVARTGARLRQRRAALAGALGPAVARCPQGDDVDVDRHSARRIPTGSCRRFVDELGRADALATLELDNEPPPVTLRVNPMRTTVDAVDRRARARAGVEVEPGDARARRAARAPHRRPRRAPALARRARHAAGPGEPGGRRRARSAAGRARARRRVRARAARRPPRPNACATTASSSPPTCIPAACARSLRAAERVGVGASVAPIVADGRQPAGRATRRSIGCCSTRRAAGSACCAAGPTRAGACSRATSRDLAALQRELLAAAAARGAARRPARLLGVHAVARRDASRSTRARASELPELRRRAAARRRRGAARPRRAPAAVRRAHRRHVRARALTRPRRSGDVASGR